MNTPYYMKCIHLIMVNKIYFIHRIYKYYNIIIINFIKKNSLIFNIIKILKDIRRNLDNAKTYKKFKKSYENSSYGSSSGSSSRNSRRGNNDHSRSFSKEKSSPLEYYKILGLNRR